MVKKFGILIVLCAGLMLISQISTSFAQESTSRIKLAALPVRERVEIQLDNAFYTLVEEERIVPLLESTAQRGNNKIDFSWSNTTINKDSIQFRPIAIREKDTFRPIKQVLLKSGQTTEEVCVINVSYPPNENALVWEVFAHKACAVKVRVSYLISNLTRSYSYRAFANKDETKLTLRKYLKLRNYSGEEFGLSGIWAGFGDRFTKEINQQEEMKILLRKFDNVPVEKTFTFDWYTFGQLNPDKPLCSKVLMHYKLINDEKNGMGLFPLQPGKVRIFIEDSRGGEAFLGEDMSALTPLDGEMYLFLGEARDVVCERKIEFNNRQNIRGNLHNQEIIVKYEIENFKDKACTLQIIEQINRLAREYAGDPHGDAEWELGDKTSSDVKITFDKGNVLPVLHIDLPARPKDKDQKVTKIVIRFHLIIKNVW
ncbi:MAG: hypothetical protein ABIH42_10440 [Planctomycetota bacterium]